MVSCSGIVRLDPPAPVPVIIFGGFCNWLEFNGVLGFKTMKNLLLFAVLVSLPLLLGSVCNAELRTWTSIVGTKVEAELVSLTGNQVTLKTMLSLCVVSWRKMEANKLERIC